MRALVQFGVIVALGLSSPVMAQSSAGTLEEKLKSIDARTLTEADCMSRLARAATSNGPELIYGGQVCDALGKSVESSFLMSAGQIRAGSDILLLPPATKPDDQSLMGLYVMLYYGGGMSGVKDEVLRDPVARERFLKMLTDWSPGFGPAYDPGWAPRKRPDAAKYRATVAQAKADLRKILDRAIRLVSDDQYYSLHRQYMAVLERNPDGVKAETPEGKLLDELQSRIRERMIALGEEVGPSPEELADPANIDKRTAETRANFPPSSPGTDELVRSSSNDPVVERCLDLAERDAVRQGGTIARVLITSNPKLGTIWRADITGGDSPTRFTCTERTSSSTPLDVGDEKIPPLPVESDKAN